MVQRQTFTSWQQMKDAFPGTVTNFARRSQRLGGHKPIGSPNVPDWLDSGGTIKIDTWDNGMRVWHYTKNGVTVSYVPEMINGQLQHAVKFPESVMFGGDIDLASVNIGEFTGDRPTNATLACRNR